MRSGRGFGSTYFSEQCIEKTLFGKSFYRVFIGVLNSINFYHPEEWRSGHSAHKTEILGSSTVFSIEIWTAANAAQSNSYKMKAIIHWGLCGLILNSFIKNICLGFFMWEDLQDLNKTAL